MTQNELIDHYNIICEKHITLNSLLPDLSDKELEIWIAGKTLLYGRSLNDSLENAKQHMKDRDKAIKLFNRKQEDYFI